MANTRKLTVMLLKEYVKSARDALRDPLSLHNAPLDKVADIQGEIWYRASKEKYPDWLSLLEELTTAHFNMVRSKSTSAVLFVRSAGRILAFTFGHGRNLLKPDSYEESFGLRVVLNLVDAGQIKSMDLQTYEDVVLSSRREVSRSADLDTFGVDVSRDILRAVTGRPKESVIAKRLTGADALTLHTSLGPTELSRICEGTINAYKDDSYRDRFGWVDNIRRVRDEKLRQALDRRLEEALRAGDLEMVQMAFPEPQDWEEIDGLRIDGTGSQEYEDLDAEDYLEELRQHGRELTVDRLRQYRVRVRYAGAQDFVAKWTVYRCIAWETKVDDRAYALLGGEWFEIRRDFLEEVDKFAKSVRKIELGLPCAKKGESEGEYNTRAVAGSNSWICLDGALVQARSHGGRIEFCDLLSKAKQIVHVKKRSRSSTLSHLFSQGVVSGLAFLRDAEVRGQLRQRIFEKSGDRGWEDIVPLEAPDARQYEVVYAVIDGRDRELPEGLPFFSRVNLMQHVRNVESAGYRVGFARICEERS